MTAILIHFLTAWGRSFGVLYYQKVSEATVGCMTLHTGKNVCNSAYFLCGILRNFEDCLRVVVDPFAKGPFL